MVAGAPDLQALVILLCGAVWMSAATAPAPPRGPKLSWRPHGNLPSTVMIVVCAGA
jgi:hypothetical protein